jgi:hypothetical protein
MKGIPQYTANAALYRTGGSYRSHTFGASGPDRVVPAIPACQNCGHICDVCARTGGVCGACAFCLFGYCDPDSPF